MNKEKKEEIAEAILRWIKSDDWDTEYIDTEDENEYSLFTGTINYLINFATAYDGFIKDLKDYIKSQCHIKNVKVKSVSQKAIVLDIENIETRIFQDYQFLTVIFKED